MKEDLLFVCKCKQTTVASHAGSLLTQQHIPVSLPLLQSQQCDPSAQQKQQQQLQSQYLSLPKQSLHWLNENAVDHQKLPLLSLPPLQTPMVLMLPKMPWSYPRQLLKQRLINKKNQSIASAPSNAGASNSPDDPDSNDEAPPMKCPQQTTQTPCHDPLPNCSHNKHPGQPDMPCAKCSLAEVQAAMKELQAIEARKSEIEAQKLQLYAELELEDEAEKELECQSVVKTWAQVQEEDFEQFSFSAVDAERSEDDEEQNEEQEEEQVAKKPQATKGTKGQTKKVVYIPCLPHCIKMLIVTQKNLKASKVWATLDSVKNDLQNGSKSLCMIGWKNKRPP